MVEEDSRVGSLHELICSLKWKCLCVCLCAYDVIVCVCLCVQGVKRQFQHPAFSSSGRYVAFAEMYFKGETASFLRSDAIVFEVGVLSWREQKSAGLYALWCVVCL